MSALNGKIKTPAIYTAEGAKAVRITSLQELIRLTMACMLWEDGFYSDGKTVGARIRELVHQVTLQEAAGVAIEARNNMKLRHAPLLIVREMARHPKLKEAPHIVGTTLAEVIQRPDELSEFLAIYWAEGKCPLSKQVKLGLAKAFTKFNKYQLAKYNRKKDIMLRDVLFLCHSKPADVSMGALPWDKCARKNVEELQNTLRPDGFTAGELLYGKLIYDQLETPDTWEVELSAGADKKDTFLRLMAENKLGDLAFLRNLRNMTEAGVSVQHIQSYGDNRKWGRVLPFRFIAAARVVPHLESHLERWMFKCLEGNPKLSGRTVLCVDVSGSMSSPVSRKSDLTRLDAAKALAMLLREICEEVVVVRFHTRAEICPPRRGFALADAIGFASGGTDIGGTINTCNTKIQHDRIIVLTDEQSATSVPSPIVKLAYMLNVAAEKHGVGYGLWLHIDGFSEAIVDYIQKYERSQGGLE